MRPEATVVITEPDGFPTDRYIVDGVAEQVGWRVVRARPHEIPGLLDGDVAAIVSRTSTTAPARCSTCPA